MKDIKIGDTVLVPFKVMDIHDSGDYPYFLGYGTSRIHASAEMLEQFQQAAGGEKDPGKTYEDGMAEAWETARKIAVDKVDGGLSREETERIFGNYFTADVFDNYTPQEAAAKIAEWEKKEICVNDEVCFEGNIGVVYDIRGGKMCEMLGRNAELYVRNKEDLTKTGRTIDIAGLLAQIGGVE